MLRMAEGAWCWSTPPKADAAARFVLSKALECGLQPIVVVNKVDRSDAGEEVLNETFELIMGSIPRGAARFPFMNATGRGGYATTDPRAGDVDLPTETWCSSLFRSDGDGRSNAGHQR